MIHFEEPEGFVSEIRVVACYVLHEGKFLLLKRHSDVTHGGKWGLPAGKVDKGESDMEALLREVREETGIVLSGTDVQELQTLWVENNGYGFEYHTFLVELDTVPQVVCNPVEHEDYTWVTPEESLTMDLIHDLKECNEFFLLNTAY